MLKNISVLINRYLMAMQKMSNIFLGILAKRFMPV